MHFHHLQMDIRDLPSLCPPPQDYVCPAPPFCGQEGALQLSTKAFFPLCSPTEAARPGYLGSTRKKAQGQTLQALPDKAIGSRREERSERTE